MRHKRTYGFVASRIPSRSGRDRCGVGDDAFEAALGDDDVGHGVIELQMSVAGVEQADEVVAKRLSSVVVMMADH